MSDDTAKSQPTGVPMDAPGERKIVPAAKDRLHGADRSGLGQEGWSEVSEDRIGHPDDADVAPEFYEPSSELGRPKDRPL